MNKIIFITLLVVGVVLMVWGISASDSFGSDVSRFFTGSATDKAMWLLLGGIAATLIGLLGMLFGSKLQ